MKSQVIQTLILAVCVSLPLAILGADKTEESDIARHAFVIWETKAGPQLAAELAIGTYPQNALMSKIMSDGKQANRDVADSPEALITNEFQLTLTADKSAILENYYGNDAKKYADMVFRNIQETQKWNKLVADIKFQTKSMFGDTIRVRYVKINKDPKAFQMPWSSLCEKINGRYYFTHTNTENSLFAMVSELYPFKDASRNNVDVKTLLSLKKVSLAPQKNSNAKIDTNVVIYYNLNQFSRNEALRKETQQVLETMLQAYENKDIPALLTVWHPDRRTAMQGKMTGDSYSFDQSKQYFSQAKSFSMDFYIGDLDNLFVFSRRILKDGSIDNTPKLYLFRRHDQKLYLTDKAASAPVLSIINTPQMAAELNKQLPQ